MPAREPAPLTTTSYALLGLLAIRSWTTYELARQMERSLNHFWPRAQSKLYEEPKKLAAHGLARATREVVGKRPRTVYAITPKGRRALARWQREAASPPVLEWEQLLKIFFSEHATKADLLATLDAARAWAAARDEENRAVARSYLEGRGPFPQRSASLALVGRFLTDFAVLVGAWAEWAGEIVESWPEGAREERPAWALEVWQQCT